MKNIYRLSVEFEATPEEAETHFRNLLGKVMVWSLDNEELLLRIYKEVFKAGDWYNV